MAKSRLLRFTVPAAIAAGTMAFASFGNLTNAGAQVPNLAPLTAEQLLAKMASAKVPAFNGTVRLVANLGLPDLGSFGGGTPNAITDLLAGTHTANIAADGAEHVAVTMSAANVETRWVRNGADVWSWNSQSQSMTHATMSSDTTSPEADKSATDNLNPTSMASQVLAAIDPSTIVGVRTSAYVAGRAAYQLVLTPKSASSTIAEVVIAVDGATGTSLDVAITAKNASKPALELGFTSISFAPQAASQFVMTPPPGITVTEAASVNDLLPISQSHHRDHEGNKPADAQLADGQKADGQKDGSSVASDGSGVVGTGWDSVMIRTAAGLNRQIMDSLSNGTKITLADGSVANIVSTPLLNVALAADGRLAVGAVSAKALKAALDAPVPAAVPTPAA